MRRPPDSLIEIQNYFKNSTDGYKLLDVKVVNKHYHIFVKCLNDLHDPYWVWWQHYKNRGDRCGKCRYITNGQKSLIYNEEKLVKIVNSLGYKIIKINTFGCEAKLTISSQEGYLLDTTINNLERGTNAQFFYYKNPHTINNIKLWCLINNQTFDLASEEFNKANDNLIWKCQKCGEHFKRSWTTMTYKPFPCPYCSGKYPSKTYNLLIKNPELAMQWNYEKNYPLRPEQVLPNLTKKFWWLCDNCGHEWMSSIHYRNNRNAPCPHCKMSKGEHRVKTFLDSHNIQYHYEHPFPDCKHIKNLRFDFYTPTYNFCIEYQGEFHYKVIEGISNAKSLERQQKCDRIKKEYCETHDINLLEIPYWEYDNVNDILKKHLK
jgi:rubrerythrin